ncbi:MAG: fumarylacetoacetate hydrolase family protein [Candidatus Bipolaricaulota bacterium]|nr:fumarylacetoacetate hydrolase family protein [Candidatus Bipolaricaulota bacterium]MCS7274609.1 fumarylacetoacetate hydrolase family protein [Candidatus Bipolaricaulota bacterium]MDW8110960.1 fumarylacetoacetate hydrolase family protein [Candidatus Bipolaricaulota bacterium]MDW8329039.1 fumarylacetoacetate hydrolase family protein [Candidatus Bipolaricaulota bacterium]
MRWVRFLHDGRARIGQVRGETVYADHERFELGSLRLLAPAQPTKIVCVGVNYRDHAAEMGRKIPERPVLFFKPPSALIGPEETIYIPASDRVDYEGEVALVIKERCKRVPASRAYEVIWGFTCFNDVTDRATQAWELNWVRAKGFDTSAALGPVLVSPDEVSEPLRIETRVNGQVRQRSDTGQLIFAIPQLIEEISSFMTLEPGDVIATGTPAGVGPLAPGDLVEVEIEGIGVLRNRVARAG